MNVIQRLFGYKKDTLVQEAPCETIKHKVVQEVPTIAERLHDSYIVQGQVEDVIMDAFKRYEPDIYEKLDFEIASDEYDNSIEIYLGFLFNIYTKIIYKDETFKNTTGVERSNRKLEYI